MRQLLSVVVAALLSTAAATLQAQDSHADVTVFGGTPSGVMAAVAAARQGRSVILVEPQYFIGGLVAGGLTKTDIGRRDTVGGLSAEFFKRVQAYYDTTYGKDSVEARASKGGVFFEPHVASGVLSTMLAEQHVQVLVRTRLLSAATNGSHINSITVQTKGGEPRRLLSTVFIDSSYEGDLMAAAHVPYRVGREGSREYGESIAGMNRGTAEMLGTGDHRVQSYNIRSTLTNVDELRVPLPKPAHYTPELYQTFLDEINRKHIANFDQLFPDEKEWGGIRGKYDPNKADGIGVNYNYPEGTEAVREGVYNELRDQWLSFWWMLQHDPSLTKEFRESALRWGLPKDEFTESGNISPQLYVREARRMLGRYLLTQDDVQVHRYKPDGVCMGSYNMDSHGVQYITVGGKTVEEGFYIVQTDPYEIPYRSLTPVSPDNLVVTAAISATHVAYSSLRMEPVYMMLGEVGGLASAQAIAEKTAVQSISVETLRSSLTKAGIPLHAPYRPVVTIQSSSTSVDQSEAVEFSVASTELRKPVEKYYWNFDGSGEVQSTEASPVWRFPADKQWRVTLIVSDADGLYSMPAYTTIKVGVGGSDVDRNNTFEHAEVTGQWDRSAAAGVEDRGRAPRHDLGNGRGQKSVTFTTQISRAGWYRVAYAYSPGVNRADNLTLQVRYRGGSKDVALNEKLKASPFSFAALGDFEMNPGTASVTVENKGSDGFVIADEVRWIWLGTKPPVPAVGK